ncbi:DUF6415 family natural product biosynthesis protein [Streptomyces sp. GbtcB6]|uniref:DUF6415 family natural product biosynthesis protein n=1 Tax=Streptomyces sp. GbtcB6 TaxID=2824751 RepID=UPI001C2FFDCC|nr:DUF6415 family natural product biosynthesis protein [Streptomyces sp. GbtcB6]
MTQATDHPTAAAEGDRLPPIDVPAMRASARRLLSGDAGDPAPDEVPVMISTLRGHLELITPVVERVAALKPDDDRGWTVPVNCAIIAAADTRRTMRVETPSGRESAVRHARRLARRLNAMCDHFQTLVSDHPETSDQPGEHPEV